MNVKEFQDLIKSKKSSLSYLRNYCWPSSQLFCPKCKGTKIYVIKNYRYRCGECRYSFTDLTGRYLGQIRLEPQKALWLIKLFELDLTALQCSKQLDISYPTAAKAYCLIRTSVRNPAEGRGVFARCRVEVDEAYFGGRKKGKRGRGADGKIAVVGLKSREGKARMEVLEDVSANSLLGAITNNVEIGSIVYTDTFKSYNDLKAIGFRHKKINHRKSFVNGRTHTNGVEGLWSFVKEGLAKHHGISKRMFPLYLAEQQFRVNNRNGDLFALLVENMCKFVPSDC